MEFEIANKFKALNITSGDWIKDGYFPNWFLEELLIRLPIKIVFRFKLVSKKWHSIILDPSFVRTYCSRALSLHKSQPWIFYSGIVHVNSKYNTCFELLVDTYSENLKWPSYYSLSLPCFPYPDKQCNVIYEVSDGFVLYGPDEIRKGFSNYRICNPITSQWISIPPHYNCEEIYVKYYMTNKCWGFMTNVKDGLLVSYTVVCLHGSPGRTFSEFITCDVFISEISEWKKYIVPVDIAINVDPLSSSAILDGVMHWMIDRHGLVAYDPRKNPDRVRIIALPHSYGDLNFNMCAAYQGKLRFFRAFVPWDSFESLNIWVLNNYSTGEWCLQHRVYFNDIKICISHPEYWIIEPISFHPYDSDIVYMRIKGMIHSYNIRTRELKIPKDFEEVKEGRGSFRSSRTLMIPPWPVSYSRPLLENLPNKTPNYNGGLQGQIPVIDFEGIGRGGSRRMEIIEEIRKASETWGSFQMINHGVPKSAMDRILEGTRKFHEQPQEAKMEFYSSKSRQSVMRFTLIKRIENLDVNWSNAFSCSFPGGLGCGESEEAIPSVCREEIVEYMEHMKDLRNSLSELLSEALGLNLGIFEKMYYYMNCEYLTCHYYPPCPEPDKTFGTRKQIDPTCLAILVQDKTGGLQIRQDGNWIDVPPVEGALIANIGNYLQLLTNDKFKSVEYRALSRPAGTHVSAACFFYPDMYHSQEIYEPLKQLVSSGENPPLYRDVTFREFTHAIEFQAQHYDPPGLSIFKL